MKLLKVLVVLFVMLACISTASAEDFTISIINDTDVLMCQVTYWMNHDIPECRGPFAICGSELKPGQDHTFNFGMVASKDRIFITRWSICRSQDEEQREKYANDMVSKIPTDKTSVKIYHKHFKVTPK